MHFRRFFPLLLVALASLLFICGLTTSAQDVAPKKRIAILNFENPNLGPGAPSGLFGADGENVGKGVSSQLILKVIQGGKYTIVDRTALEKLLMEQSDADKERVDAYGMAAKIGRLLKLDAMIIGAITRYGPDDNHDAKNVEKPRSAVPGILGPPIHTRKSKAFVEISIQVLNMSTGEVIASFIGTGESASSGNITVLPTRDHSKPAPEMLGSEFVNSLLGDATRNAIDQIAAQLNLFADKIPSLKIAIDALVAEVSGNTVTLNVGKQSGLKVGDKLEIFRNVPASAAPADSTAVPPLNEQIGLAIITEVADNYATATFSGSGHAQVGDHARAADNSGAPPH